MRKWSVWLLVTGLFSIGLVSLGAAEREAEKPATVVEPAEEPPSDLVVPAKVLVNAKVVDWQELLKFLPKTPEGWRAQKPTGKIQKLGPFAVSEVRQVFLKGGQRIEFILEDLGSNNPYVFRKEAWQPLEKKTEEAVSKKIMLGETPAELSILEKTRQALVFLVFEKRIQLNVSGTAMTEGEVLIELAKQIDFKELKKTLDEKSK
ncbi:MAG: hypothetical protein Q8Q12_20310 [bacterium]|nr:hypothetical protein [bacterium]